MNTPHIFTVAVSQDPHPCAGLDSNAALVVMECMKRLAQQQRIVISSIHQPRAAIWDLFTKVQVLSEGRMLYFGPTDQACPCTPRSIKWRPTSQCS